MTISDYLSEILHDSIKAVAEKQMTISIEITPEHESIRIEPSADVVKRKRGEWFDRGSLSCRCSNCGCKSTKEYNFCPHCGADMRGRDDERTD